jgi:hypothetical protein
VRLPSLTPWWEEPEIFGWPVLINLLVKVFLIEKNGTLEKNNTGGSYSK